MPAPAHARLCRRLLSLSYLYRIADNLGHMNRIFARATLAFFVLRALLPTGFMPDLGALSAGQIELVICTAHGDAAAPVNLPDGAPHKSPGADCPFGMAVAKLFVAPVVPAAYAIAAPTDGGTPHVVVSTLLPSQQGPPLGSRAPPLA